MIDERVPGGGSLRSRNRRNARLGNALLLVIGMGVGFAIGYVARSSREVSEAPPVFLPGGEWQESRDEGAAGMSGGELP